MKNIVTVLALFKLFPLPNPALTGACGFDLAGSGENVRVVVGGSTWYEI